jgi:hypothetical protein
MSQPYVARGPVGSAGDLRDSFLLDPAVVFLNHGSFGACPQPVFAVSQGWQREFEGEPVDLFERRLDDLLAAARAALGEHVGAPADDLALVLSATSALNTVLRSLSLGPGDEILTTAHGTTESTCCSSSSRGELRRGRTKLGSRCQGDLGRRGRSVLLDGDEPHCKGIAAAHADHVDWATNPVPWPTEPSTSYN